MDDGDVRGGQGLEVVDAWGGSAAAYARGGDDYFFEGRVLEFFAHLLGDVRAHVCLGFAVGEEKLECAVDTRLVLLAELEEQIGVFNESLDFFSGIVARWFWAKGAEYPGALADETGEMADGRLDGFEYLLAGGSNLLQASREMVGMCIVVATYPFPMMPTRLPFRSILSFQFALCIKEPLKSCSPGISGQRHLFNTPAALIRMSQVSLMILLSSARSWMRTCQFAVSSFHSAPFT